jgi:hypothetical protein
MAEAAAKAASVEDVDVLTKYKLAGEMANRTSGREGLCSERGAAFLLFLAIPLTHTVSLTHSLPHSLPRSLAPSLPLTQTHRHHGARVGAVR